MKGKRGMEASNAIRAKKVGAGIGEKKTSKSRSHRKEIQETLDKASKVGGTWGIAKTAGSAESCKNDSRRERRGIICMGRV